MRIQLAKQLRPGLGILASKSGLKIGVDLDNTLINYDSAFFQGARDLGLLAPGWQGNKKQIRDYLCSHHGGEFQWQNLQGQVYGRLISHARLFDGVYRFLWRCRQRGCPVDLVSHKTEYGHNDNNRVPLRKVALEFLASHGIVPGEDGLLRGVSFENTREQKVQRIIENNYDWFVDDLAEVLEDALLPNELGRILFDESAPSLMGSIERYCSWAEIEHRLLGAWTEHELRALAETLASATVTSVKWATGGGNSGLLEVVMSNGEKSALKLYSGCSVHDRLNSEYDSIRAIKAHDASSSVPAPRGCDRRLSIAMYEWIDGEVVDRPRSEHIQQALEFLGDLHGLRGLTAFESFQNASAAFVSGASLEDQVRSRFQTLMLPASTCQELYEYLQFEVLPVIEEVTSWTRSGWRVQPYYSEPLPRSQQTLSPSDFGFHNAIERENGRLAFIDFEYFGWDDPVKLIVDFCFHPGMVLNSTLKQQWIEGAVKIYGEEVLDRLQLAWPMIGLCWCLILLNEYRGDVWLRRCIADAEKVRHREAILATQLRRSRALLGTIRDRHEQFPFY